jgi:hypothetical protein
MPTFISEDTIIVCSDEGNISWAKNKGLKEMGLDASNYSKEEYLLYQIISSAELILDDLHDGHKLTDRNLDQIKLADQILLDIQQDLDNVNKPSHLK